MAEACLNGLLLFGTSNLSKSCIYSRWRAYKIHSIYLLAYWFLRHASMVAIISTDQLFLRIKLNNSLSQVANSHFNSPEAVGCQSREWKAAKMLSWLIYSYFQGCTSSTVCVAVVFFHNIFNPPRGGISLLKQGSERAPWPKAFTVCMLRHTNASEKFYDNLGYHFTAILTSPEAIITMMLHFRIPSGRFPFTEFLSLSEGRLLLSFHENALYTYV